MHNFLIYFALFYAFTKTGIFASAKALSSTMIQIDTTFPFFKILGSANPDAMWTLRGYISNPGRYFSLYALIGLIGVAFAYLKNKKMFVPATIMTIWIAVFCLKIAVFKQPRETGPRYGGAISRFGGRRNLLSIN